MTAQQVWEDRAWLARVRRDGPQGWICGAAFLIDDRHLITCAHVVLEAAATGPRQRVYIDFPLLDDEGCWAEVLEDGWAPEDGTRGDTAVLQLERTVTGMEPVPVRAVSSLRGQAFLAYGFPQHYNEGRETTGRVGGPVGREWQQLEVALPDLAVQSGFSGGAVWSTDLQAVVGLVVTRDAGAEGRLAFAVPVPVLAARSAVVTSALPTALDLDPARDTHWLPRAHGGSDRGGTNRWLFQGRRQVLTELVEWMTRDDAPAQRVVTGTPGSGKSAVLARLLVTADRRQRLLVPQLDLTAAWVPPSDAVAVTFHAHGKTVKDLVTHIADVLDLVGIDGPERLRKAIGVRPGLRLVVDAVDEAAQPREMARLLTDLSRGGTRVLLGCREHLLNELDDVNPMCLDRAPYLQPEDVRDFVAALLGSSGTRSEAALDVAAVAEEVVTAAEGNFLVAQLVAQSIELGGGTSRPFPRQVHQAFERLLGALPDEAQARDLLLPLAYSKGEGLPAGPLWLTAATALRRTYIQADLDDLLASPTAAFLTIATKNDDGPRYRLFHQALGEALIRIRNVESDARSLWTAWQDAVLDSGWPRAAAYLRTHAAEHAADAGQLTRLLEDVDYLAVADFTRLLPLLPNAAGDEDLPIVRVLQQTGQRAAGLPANRRLGLLAATATHHQLHVLRRRLLADSGPLSLRWAHTLGVPHQELAGHTDRVEAVALGRIRDRYVIASGSADGTVRIWDASTGQSLGDPFAGTHPVQAVAMGRVGDQDIIVSGGRDGSVQVWDATTGRPQGNALTGHAGAITAVALGRVGDRDIIVSASWDETVRIWDATTGRPQSDATISHMDAVTAVTLGRLGDRDVIVSGSRDESLRVWDASTGLPLSKHLFGHTGAVTALALGRLGEENVFVSGSMDQTVQIWEADSRQPKAVMFHSYAVAAVALGRVGDRDVIVSGNWDGTVQVWDAGSGQALGDPLTGHTRPAVAVALGRVDERDIIVSGGWDAAVRIWDASSAQPSTERLPGHTQPVHAVALGRTGDRDVIVSGSADRTVHVWDANTGQALGGPYSVAESVHAVALGQVGNRDVIVAGGWDGTLQMWDIATGRPLDDPLRDDTDTIHAVALGRAGDRDIISAGSADGSVQIWDATTGQPLGERPIGHSGPVHALALGRVGDRDVVVSGGLDGEVRIWDALADPTGHPLNGARRCISLTGHTEPILAVAIGVAGDVNVVASGSADGTVRMWDAATAKPLGESLMGHEGQVRAVALGRVGDRDLVVSGSDDRTVRVWDACTGEGLQTIDLLGPASALALGPQTLAVAVASAVCVFTVIAET